MPFEIDPAKDVSYINLTILDATKAVEMGAKEKLKEKTDSIRFPMVRKILQKDAVQKKIAKIAAKKVKPSLIAKQLESIMPKILMYMMYHKIGMKVAAKSTFCEDSYLVVEFQVKHVDTQKLLAKIKEGKPDEAEEMDMEVPPEVLDAWIQDMEAAQGDDPSTPVKAPLVEPSSSGSSSSGTETFLGWIAGHLEYVAQELLPTGYKESLEHDSLPNTVQSKITDEMGAMMEKKLAQKELEAEIAVLHSASQARYFYSNLEVVRERKDSSISSSSSSSS